MKKLLTVVGMFCIGYSIGKYKNKFETFKEQINDRVNDIWHANR